MTQLQNVDPAEIAKFEALASRWWDKESEFKPLHDINPLRLDYINDYAQIAGKRIIDVGCGGGILAESMAQLGANVTGIDMGDAPLSIAKLHLLETGVEVDYRQIRAEDMAQQQAGTFDVVTCMEMLEHVPEPESIINACFELAKPGGWVFFSTINRNPKAFMLAIVGAEHLLRLLPKGTHEYEKFIKPSEMEAAMRATGLELIDITGMSYNPLTRAYKLGRDVSVNYLMAARRPQHD